jgi:hypothetical protein
VLSAAVAKVSVLISACDQPHIQSFEFVWRAYSDAASSEQKTKVDAWGRPINGLDTILAARVWGTASFVVHIMFYIGSSETSVILSNGGVAGDGGFFLAGGQSV